MYRVWHVVNLKSSLVSIDMVAKDKYNTTRSESSWLITKGNLKISHVKKYNNWYLLIMISLEGSLHIAEMLNATLWHGRLGHMSPAGLEQISVIGYILKIHQAETNFSKGLHYQNLYDSI